MQYIVLCIRSLRKTKKKIHWVQKPSKRYIVSKKLVIKVEYAAFIIPNSHSFCTKSWRGGIASLNPGSDVAAAGRAGTAAVPPPQAPPVGEQSSYVAPPPGTMRGWGVRRCIGAGERRRPASAVSGHRACGPSPPAPTASLRRNQWWSSWTGWPDRNYRAESQFLQAVV